MWILALVYGVVSVIVAAAGLAIAINEERDGYGRAILAGVVWPALVAYELYQARTRAQAMVAGRAIR